MFEHLKKPVMKTAVKVCNFDQPDSIIMFEADADFANHFKFLGSVDNLSGNRWKLYIDARYDSEEVQKYFEACAKSADYEFNKKKKEAEADPWEELQPIIFENHLNVDMKWYASLISNLMKEEEDEVYEGMTDPELKSLCAIQVIPFSRQLEWIRRDLPNLEHLILDLEKFQDDRQKFMDEFLNSDFKTAIEFVKLFEDDLPLWHRFIEVARVNGRELELEAFSKKLLRYHSFEMLKDLFD